MKPTEKLSEFLDVQKKKYLERRKEKGGTSEGFRQWIAKLYNDDPDFFASRVLDSLMESTTRNWQKPPRKSGPDLFSISGISVPEHLTRQVRGSYATGDEIEADNEDAFEKVDANFATVSDAYEDATIKMRKAAQSSAAAETRMKMADEARKRAKGNLSKRLKDIADEE